MKSKLCIVYNYAQLYREPIFKLIDEAWECEWYFGRNTTDIKGMDTSLLSNVVMVDNKKFMGSFLYQTDVYREYNTGDYHAVILLGEPFNLSTWAILIKNKFRKTPKKIYLWSHGWYGKEGLVKRLVKRLFFRLADKTFLYGNYAKQVAIRQGFPADKLIVIHNSLDHSYQVSIRKNLRVSDIYRSYFGNNNPVLIFIGRLTEVKRLDLLIEAIAILKNDGKFFNVVLIGDGEKRNTLQNEVVNKGLEKQFWFYGSCYDDIQTSQLIFDADLCVSPGNVGLTAMHTMVYGTPVLTHDDFPWQMPEFEAIKINETGNFFHRGDAISLANNILTWIETHPNREAVRQACYREIDTFWTPEYQLKLLKEHIDN